jgi:hypothetical protein
MPAYSGSLTFSTNITLDDCVPGDIISFRLVSEYLPTSKNYTASISEGSLVVDLNPPLNGAYPFATSSATFGNFISGSESPNVLVLNTSLQAFVGDYLQVPIFTSVTSSGTITTTSSLYSQYGDITYPFSINPDDKIVMYGDDGRTQELIILSTNETNIDGKFRISVQPNLDQYFIDYPTKIASFLMVKRVPDEQNIILQFKKQSGPTSYGFLISDDIDPNLINNISTIQTNVQNQLLSTQENTG